MIPIVYICSIGISTIYMAENNNPKTVINPARFLFPTLNIPKNGFHAIGYKYTHCIIITDFSTGIQA